MAPIYFDFTGDPVSIEGAEVLDCTSLEETRRYCSPEAERQLAAMISGRYSGVHFLGSGDYHYISKIFCDSIAEPFDLLLFDHHPDMQKPVFEGVLSCGGWVRDMLEQNRFLRNVTIVGMAGELMPETEGFPGRVTVFPEGACVHSVPGALPIYISVDKDAFCPCFARTNWDQGSLTLPEFGKVLHLLSGDRRVLGADICGSMPISEGGTRMDAALNSETDRILLEHFC